MELSESPGRKTNWSSRKAPYGRQSGALGKPRTEDKLELSESPARKTNWSSRKAPYERQIGALAKPRTEDKLELSENPVTEDKFESATKWAMICFPTKFKNCASEVACFARRLATSNRQTLRADTFVESPRSGSLYVTSKSRLGQLHHPDAPNRKSAPCKHASAWLSLRDIQISPRPAPASSGSERTARSMQTWFNRPAKWATVWLFTKSELFQA